MSVTILQVKHFFIVSSTVEKMERVMSRVTGFTIFDKATGNKLATLPLTIPIGSTVEAYERAGHNVNWGWEKDNE
jgi:hypothetical protein